MWQPVALYLTVLARKNFEVIPKKIFDSPHVLPNLASSMNILRPSTYAIALTSLALSGAIAQTTATTDPVGFVSYAVNANSDQKVGVPMTPAAVFAGTASSVAGTSVTATSSGIPTLSGKNMLLVTSGSAAGSWEEVASNTGNSVSLLASIAGFASSDSFEIRPFWTLSSLLPNGGSVPVSPNPEEPQGLVLLNAVDSIGINPASGAAYLYHDGSVLPAGWYENGTFEEANNVVVSPESFLTVRNLTASNINVAFVGSVPTQASSIAVVRRSGGQQDNLILNQFPADVTLANSDLVTSGAVTPSPNPEEPVDLLLVYALANSGLNPASSAAYLYHDGSILPAGWYENGTFAESDAVPLPAGAAIVIRKGAGPNQVLQFNPELPYSL